MHPPIASITKWSCGLAAVAWSLSNFGKPVDQEILLERFGAFFPAWKTRPGILSRCEIPRFLEMNGLDAGKYILSSDPDELLAIYTTNAQTYACGFILTRQPISHCMAITEFHPKYVGMMDGDPVNPRFLRATWEYLREREADLLLVFLRPEKTT